MFLLMDDPKMDVVPQTPLIETNEMMGLEFDGDLPADKAPYLNHTRGGQQKFVRWLDIGEDIPDLAGSIEDQIENFDAIKPNEQKGNLKAMLIGRTRKEQLAVWFQGIDAMRKQLFTVRTKEELYAIATFAADLDQAMEETNSWNKGFDSLDKLSREFAHAELMVAERARKDAYVRAVQVMSFRNKEAETVRA